MRIFLNAVTIPLLILATPGAALSQTAEPVTVEVGVLTCIVGDSTGADDGHAVTLECDFDRIGDAPGETYVGEMQKRVREDALAPKATMIWQVMAPTTELAVGALAGAYRGTGTPAAEGGDDGPPIFLQGGPEDAISLLPLSETAHEVMKLAAVSATLALKTVKA